MTRPPDSDSIEIPDRLLAQILRFNKPGWISSGESSTALRRDDIVRDKWLIRGVVGRGGFARVFLASQVDLPEHRVAIKVLRNKYAHDPEALARFQQEAEVLARVRSEHIPQLIESGKLGDGHPYIVMEWLEGETLRDRVEREGKLDLAAVAELTKQLGLALEHVHDKGIVHRDLKPANIFLCTKPNNRVKLLDFGIAKTSRELTDLGASPGTPRYTAPEVTSRSVPQDSRVDQYALGLVLIECLIGPSLDQGAGDATAEPTSAIPVHIRAILERATARDPTDRFDSIGEFVRQMLRCIALAQETTSRPRVGGRGSLLTPPAPAASKARPLSIIALGTGTLSVMIWWIASSLTSHTTDNGPANEPAPGVVVGTPPTKAQAVQALEHDASTSSSPLASTTGEATGDETGDETGDQAGGAHGGSLPASDDTVAAPSRPDLPQKRGRSSPRDRNPVPKEDQRLDAEVASAMEAIKTEVTRKCSPRHSGIRMEIRVQIRPDGKHRPPKVRPVVGEAAVPIPPELEECGAKAAREVLTDRTFLPSGVTRIERVTVQL